MLPLIKLAVASAKLDYTGRVEVVLMPSERHLCSWAFCRDQCAGEILATSRARPMSVITNQVITNQVEDA